jgi:2-keto-4-pentenoate hydratase
MHAGIVQSDSRLRLADFTKLAIEPEIAVYMGSDVVGGADRTAIRTAIAALGPALEIADLSFPPSDGPEKILAGNIYHKGVVLGVRDELRAGAELRGLAATVCRDGSEVEVPDDLESNTGALVDIVAIVADTLAEAGERLSAGDVIIAGSIVPPIFIDAATIIAYTLGEAEPISITIA